MRVSDGVHQCPNCCPAHYAYMNGKCISTKGMEGFSGFCPKGSKLGGSSICIVKPGGSISGLGAYFLQNGGGPIRTGDISHFRQPYKDYTQLSGFGEVAVNSIGLFAGGLYWIPPGSIDATLKGMAAVPADASKDQSLYHDPSLLEMGLIDPGGQLPVPSAFDVCQQFITDGYCVIFVTLSNTNVTMIVATKNPSTIASIAGKGGIGNIYSCPPDLGLKASALTDGSPGIPIPIIVKGAPPGSKTASIADSKPMFGPLGVAAITFGGLGVAYWLYKKYAKKSRKVS